MSTVTRTIWHSDRTDQPLSVIGALTGVAPEEAAARRELKNLLRRSPEKGPGRPRGRSPRGLSRDQLAAIRADALWLRKVLARHRGKRVLQEDAICDVLGRSARTHRAVERFFARKDRERRDLLIFVLARLHGLPESAIKRSAAL